MDWINPQDRMPAAGTVVRAQLQHATTKNVVEHDLKSVAESDCCWRTADDNSEVSYDWTVIGWRSV